MKKWIWGIVIVVVIIIIAALAGKGKDTSAIKVGFIGPITGDAASLGFAAQAATEIAVDEINALGGINGRQIEMIYEDGKCTAVAASNAAQKLINVDKVTAIIGGLCSGETSSYVKLAKDNKVPVISYCSSAPSLSQSGNYFFRTYPSDAFQGKYAAEYAYNTLGARKIAMLYHISDWGNGIRDVFTNRFIELGGQIVDTEGTTQDSRNYKTQLAKIKSLNPDYIYMVLYPEGGVVAVQQALDLGIKTKILAADAWDETKLIATINKKADIVYVSSTGEATQEFKDKFFKKTGKDVSICGPQAYDAVNALVMAMKKVGTDADKLPDAIRSLNFMGAISPVSFDKNGDINFVSYRVKRIADNKSTVIVQ